VNLKEGEGDIGRDIIDWFWAVRERETVRGEGVRKEEENEMSTG
jgi:hypothetical protein